MVRDALRSERVATSLQRMPIRRLPDGTVVADTPQELAAYDRAVAATPKAEPKPRRARRAPKANGRASAQGPAPRRRRGRAGEWSVQAFRSFVSGANKRTREVIDAALKLGDGASSLALAEKLASSPHGIGKRIAKVAIDAEQFNDGLPVPVTFGGDRGHRLVVIDPSFQAAAQEVQR